MTRSRFLRTAGLAVLVGLVAGPALAQDAGFGLGNPVCGLVNFRFCDQPPAPPPPFIPDPNALPTPAAAPGAMAASGARPVSDRPVRRKPLLKRKVPRVPAATDE